MATASVASDSKEVVAVITEKTAAADVKRLLRELENAAWKCGTDEYSDGASEAGIRRRAMN